jgi:GT2 family glycosyltransferase
MKMTYRASLIISIYDNVEFLKSVLDSLKYQTEQNFEIVISEDAEHKSVKDFISKYDFKQDFQHLTQPDNGWQKNKALNRAISAAKSDWLIFIDGDCVLHPRFVEFHTKLAEKNAILAGKRIKLNSELSSNLLKDSSFIFQLQRKIVKLFFNIGNKKGIRFIEEGIFINPKSFFGFIPKMRRMYQLKGCNMSFSKEAAFAINGFDEDFSLPAIGEDIDLTWRFKAAGYKLKSVRNLAVQYHLHHKESWTDQTKNLLLMEEKKKQNQFYTLNGLKK